MAEWCKEKKFNPELTVVLKKNTYSWVSDVNHTIDVSTNEGITDVELPICPPVPITGHLNLNSSIIPPMILPVPSQTTRNSSVLTITSNSNERLPPRQTTFQILETSCKPWREAMAQGYIQHMELLAKQKQTEYEELQIILQSLEQNVAEEEALLRGKQERIKVKKASLIAEEEKVLKEIGTMEIERKANEKKIEATSQKLQDEKLYYRIVGTSLLKNLRVNYRSRRGKILCPEGKICGSENPNEDECDYWNCPLLISIENQDMVTNLETTASTVNNTTIVPSSSQKF